jgi:hypothetical protein
MVMVFLKRTKSIVAEDKLHNEDLCYFNSSLSKRLVTIKLERQKKDQITKNKDDLKMLSSDGYNMTFP